MKDHLPLRTLPSSHGEKATSSAPVPGSAAETAFARQHAEVVDAASAYAALPLELRLLALGLSSAIVMPERDGDQSGGADQLAA